MAEEADGERCSFRAGAGAGTAKGTRSPGATEAGMGRAPGARGGATSCPPASRATEAAEACPLAAGWGCGRSSGWRISKVSLTDDAREEPGVEPRDEFVEGSRRRFEATANDDSEGDTSAPVCWPPRCMTRRLACASSAALLSRLALAPRGCRCDVLMRCLACVCS